MSATAKTKSASKKGKEWTGETQGASEPPRRLGSIYAYRPVGVVCSLPKATSRPHPHLPTLIACSYEARRVYASPAVARRLHRLDRRCEAAPASISPTAVACRTERCRISPASPPVRPPIPTCTPKRRCGGFAGSKWSSLTRLRRSKFMARGLPPMRKRQQSSWRGNHQPRGRDCRSVQTSARIATRVNE